MKKFASAAIFIVILISISVFEIYNTWDSREIYFKKEPQFILRNVAHILVTDDYIAVTYKKDDLLVKERFQFNGKPKLSLVIQKAKGNETYIEFFPGARDPMLWFKDSEFNPPVTLMVIYCGPNIAGFDWCDSFKTN